MHESISISQFVSVSMQTVNVSRAGFLCFIRSERVLNVLYWEGDIFVPINSISIYIYEKYCDETLNSFVSLLQTVYMYIRTEWIGPLYHIVSQDILDKLETVQLSTKAAQNRSSIYIYIFRSKAKIFFSFKLSKASQTLASFTFPPTKLPSR